MAFNTKVDVADTELEENEAVVAATWVMHFRAKSGFSR